MEGVEKEGERVLNEFEKIGCNRGLQPRRVGGGDRVYSSWLPRQLIDFARRMIGRGGPDWDTTPPEIESTTPSSG